MELKEIQDKLNKLREQKSSLNTKIEKLQQELRKEAEAQREADKPENVKDWNDLYLRVEKLINRKLTDEEKEVYKGTKNEWQTAKALLKCRYDFTQASQGLDLEDRANEDFKRYLEFGVLEYENLNNGLCNLYSRFNGTGLTNNFFINGYHGYYGDWAKPENWVECGNCGEIDQGEKCYDCKDKFCDNCIEDNLCYSCQNANEQKCINGCEAFVGKDYDWEQCWKCEKAFCGDCISEIKINDQMKKICRDCESNSN